MGGPVPGVAATPGWDLRRRRRRTNDAVRGSNIPSQRRVRHAFTQIAGAHGPRRLPISSPSDERQAQHHASRSQRRACHATMASQFPIRRWLFGRHRRPRSQPRRRRRRPWVTASTNIAPQRACQMNRVEPLFQYANHATRRQGVTIVRLNQHSAIKWFAMPTPHFRRSHTQSFDAIGDPGLGSATPMASDE